MPAGCVLQSVLLTIVSYTAETTQAYAQHNAQPTAQHTPHQIIAT
jgi:hypothetical protein